MTRRTERSILTDEWSDLLRESLGKAHGLGFVLLVVDPADPTRLSLGTNGGGDVVRRALVLALESLDQLDDPSGPHSVTMHRYEPPKGGGS